MILVIDNYDSFVHNLARYFRQLGCETIVRRNDAITIDSIRKLAPKAIVISPGPCTPDQAGCSVDVVREFGESIPILGICLGHQAIVQALGGTIVQAHQPVHGRQSQIRHDGSKMFNGIKSRFLAGRYHSLVAQKSDLPKDFTVTATTEDPLIMAVQHKSWPLIGLQFHPESILTQCGYQLLINFLKLANIEVPEPEFWADEPKGSWGGIYPGTDQEDTKLSDRLSQQDLL